MYTKPISTEVIASHKATLISGFAPLIFKEGKFVFVCSEDAVEDRSKLFCQEMVDVLNSTHLKKSSPMNMMELMELEKIQNLQNDLHKDGSEDALLVCALFGIVVVYPFLLKTFEPMTIVEGLQQLIMDRMMDCISTLEADDQHLMKEKVEEYFESVYQREKRRAIDFKCPGLTDFIKSGIINDSVFQGARARFPSALLPCANVGTPLPRGKGKESFQDHYHCYQYLATTKKVLPYTRRHHLIQVLPALYIVSQPELDGMDQGAMMAKLTTDLSAAKDFYEKLLPLEQTTPGFESSEKADETYSANILRNIEIALQSVKSHPDASEFVVDDTSPQAQPIYQFLLKFHLMDLWSEAMVTYLEVSKADEKSAIPAFNLINFCNAFHHTGMLDKDQIVVLREIIRCLHTFGQEYFGVEGWDVMQDIQNKYPDPGMQHSDFIEPFAANVQAQKSICELSAAIVQDFSSICELYAANLRDAKILRKLRQENDQDERMTRQFRPQKRRGLW